MMTLFDNRRIPHVLLSLLTLASVSLLQGCFWESNDDPAPSYGIGGTVSGLTGTVKLQNNGGSDLTVTSDGDFSFGAGFGDGTDYAVTVLTNPDGQGCTVSNGSGSVSGATVSNIIVNCADDANPTGYYTGSVSVRDTDDTTSLEISDAQILINGTRMMIVSDSKAILYDGELDITGTSFTSTVTIYQNGSNVGYTATVEGDINEGSEVTGTFTGEQLGNGTFVSTYDETLNNEFATQAIVGDKTWAIKLNESTGTYFFKVDLNGNLTHFNNGTDRNFQACEMTGTILKISNTHLYEVTVNIINCDNPSAVEGDFTGLAAINNSGNLVFTISDSDKVYATADESYVP